MTMFAGTTLTIDLSKKMILHTPTDMHRARMFLGGRGASAAMLLECIPPHIDPLSEDNVLILATGPFTGTSIPLTSRFTASTKSPLTESYLDSSCGGSFGPEMKFAGYDFIVIRGKSETPCYISIETETTQILDASHLWGKDSFETFDILKRDHKGKKAIIGRAGENCVKYACVSIDRFRQLGRGGVGAVFGSKNLKAITVRGDRDLEIPHFEKFWETMAEYHDYINRDPWTQDFIEAGTVCLVEMMNELGVMPVENFSDGSDEKAERIDAEEMKKYLIQNKTCSVCSVQCGKLVRSKDGKYLEGPDYETIGLLGSNLGIFDFDFIIKANLACDDFGMDTISVGGTIAFAMEAARNGLLEGIPPFGDTEGVMSLLEDIALRRGIGNLLAEGSKIASEKIGGKDYAIQIKGMEIAAYDPRGSRGMTLAYATADRGGCHLRGWPIEAEMNGKMNRFSFENQAAHLIHLQHCKAVLDSLIRCEMVDLNEYDLKLLNILTDWDLEIEDLYRMGERIYNTSRIFIVREGMGRKDDSIPKKLFNVPVRSGASKGHIIPEEEFNRAIDEYYSIRKWDKNGVPTREKLVELGIDSFLR
jgi:aldehyde:ferredoxin oxidoreductase